MQFVLASGVHSSVMSSLSGRVPLLAFLLAWGIGSFAARESSRGHTFDRGDGRPYFPLVAAALALLVFVGRRHRGGWRPERRSTAFVGFLLALGLLTLGLLAALIVFVAPTATRASVALPPVAGTTAACLAAAAVLALSGMRS